MGKYSKVYASNDFVRVDESNYIAVAKTKQGAARLASCWNACLNLENPETDIPKLIEALKIAKNALHAFESATETTIDEALALVLEDK